MTRKINQSGAASIMFAMVMIVIISMIAIAFGTLVRNDQRQTLDKTLSSQAQYAAESAINRQAEKLKDATYVAANPTSSDCSNKPILSAAYPDITISCLNWNSQPDVLSLQNVSPAQTQAFKIKPLDPLQNINYFAILWSPKTACTPNNTWVQTLDPLGNAATCPNLKIVFSDTSNAYANNAALVAYSRPQTDPSAYPTSANTFSIPEGIYASAGYAQQTAGSQSGEIDNTYCVLVGGRPSCLVRIALPGGISWTRAKAGLISVSTIGGPVDVKLAAYTVPFAYSDTSKFFTGLNVEPVLWASNRAKLTEVQAVIDATAKSTDVIKRIQATVPLSPDTWVPGFTASADSICKNYMLNATGNATAPINSPSASDPCY